MASPPRSTTTTSTRTSPAGITPGHSVDLWFFFETLAKCWRPFVGRHYDLARRRCNYWANFIRSGDPNGQDATGEEMPRWEPHTATAPHRMEFRDDPACPLQPPSDIMRLLLARQLKRQVGGG